MSNTRLGPRPALSALLIVTLGFLTPLFLAISGLAADLRSLADPVIAVTAGCAPVVAITTKDRRQLSGRPDRRCTEAG